MTDTPANGPKDTADLAEPYGGAPADSEPIDAEFRSADPVPPGDGGGGARGPGWTGAIALAVLAAIGGSVGGTLGGRLLAAPRATDAVGAGPTGQAAILAETAALGARIDAADARAIESAETVATLRETLATLEADLDKVDRIATFDRRLAALETANEAAGEDAGPTELALSALTGRLDTVETELTALRRATDALAAATDGLDADALNARLADLDTQLAMQSEAAAAGAQAGTDAAANAGLALALADIARAAASGDPFPGAQADLAAAMPDDAAVLSLAPIAADGAATVDELARQFSALCGDALAADPAEPEGGLGVAQRLFGDQIKVRREGEVSVADQLGAAGAALDSGDLPAALDAIDPLPAEVQVPLEPWREAAAERLALETALDSLRRTLATGPQPTLSEQP
ncbi:MAG: hypothetical protein AAF253_01055 [Pseudomonadota bacterium]